MKECMASDLSKLDLLVTSIEEDLMLLAAVGVDGLGDKHPSP
jgi:putative transposase